MHGNRTRLRQELMKQALELERKRDEDDSRRRREMAVTQQSSTISVPSVTQTPMADVSLEVPNDVLKVRTQLAHPTNYHVTEVQRKQVQHFLTSHGTPIQTRSAPAHNLTGFGMPRAASLGGAQKDPLLSGAMGASGNSPLKPNSFNPTMGSPIKHSPVNPSLNSPGKAGSFGATGTHLGGGLFGNPPNNLVMKSESPTMMSVDHTPEDLQYPPQIQEQIIEDIMGLEQKFGDYTYLESEMMAPQTLPVTSNLFDTFGGMNMVTPNGAVAGGAGAGPLVIPQMSASCPTSVKEERDMMQALNSMGVKHFEKERQKKNNHNAIERRRRFNINDRIKELGMLLPPNETEARQNKGTILKASVEYIRKLQRDLQKLRIHDAKQRQLEETNRQMRLRIQELELTARAHGIPTPSLNPETVKLAEAADQALGSMTPTSKSPSSAAVTPVNIFGNDDLADILRASPGIDLSKLQIKQEPVDSPSSHLGDNLSPSPMPRPSSGGQPFDPQHVQQQQQQAVGDIFSFNIPMTSTDPSTMAPSIGMETAASTTNSSTVQFFTNT